MHTLNTVVSPVYSIPSVIVANLTSANLQTQYIFSNEFRGAILSSSV